jgi:hypothetical protein
MADAADVATDVAKSPEGGNSQPKTYPEEVVKELIAARDELKRKLRDHDDAKKKSEEQKLAEAGKLQELLQAKDKELAELMPLKEEIEQYRKEKAEQREQLLKKIPKDDRALFEGTPLAALQKAVELYEAAEAEPTEASKPKGEGVEKDLSQMSGAEQLALKSSNPSLWAKLFSADYEKKYGRKPPPQYLK